MNLLSTDGGAAIKRLLQESNTTKHLIPWLGLAKPIDATAFDDLIMKWFRWREDIIFAVARYIEIQLGEF